MRNLLGSEQQRSQFSEIKVREFAETYGINLEREISRYGIDLTDTQQRMVEAILHGFSKTRYKGNLDPIDKPSHAKEKYPSGGVPNAYNNLSQLPRLRVSQAEILRWAGVDQKSVGEIQLAIKALKHLGTTQYCFYYTRLAIDEGGLPKKDRDGGFQKEEVIAVDTLFTVKEVRSKKTGLLDYYEIIPTSIFLDQRESYFMLIPFNWREEVRKLIGQRKASSYTFRFLLFLRYQFELQRRSEKGKREFVFKCTPEDMAIRLKMPESVYKRKKERASQILEETYRVAKQLGYLRNYERTPGFDLLYFNEEKYSLPKYEEKLPPLIKEEENNTPERQQAKLLIDLMIQERRKLLPKYNPVSGGHVRDQSLTHLTELLKLYSFEEIGHVIAWGLNKPYWCNRIGTPSLLRKYFHEALAEMRAFEKKDRGGEKQQQIAAHRELAIAIASKLQNVDLPHPLTFEVLSQYVEISLLDSPHTPPVCIAYTEKGFREQIENALRKASVPFPLL